MSRRKPTGSSGSTLVEFAFVLVLLLATAFGGLEMDRMILAHTSLGNAARAGVRYASVHGKYADGAINATTTDNIGQVVKNFAGMGTLDASRMTISETCTNGSGAYINVCYQDGNDNLGSRVSVTVNYPYTPFTTFFPFSVSLSSTAKGIIAF